MKFKVCENCCYKGFSEGFCYDICALPLDIITAVEEYFNNKDYPEDLELHLCNIVESEDYKYEKRVFDN